MDERVKVVEGENSLIYEDIEKLSDNEIINMLRCHSASLTTYISVLITPKRAVSLDEPFKKLGYEYVDTTVFVYKNLADHRVGQSSSITLKPLKEFSEDLFVKIWGEVMEGSLNSSSSLSVEGHMASLKKEIGEDYQTSCLLAFENDTPIGAVIPHIEPGTVGEGRLFYIGILPGFRGYGRAKYVHALALESLEKDFSATHYIGATSHNNIPMLKAFTHNGCKELVRKRVYKKKI
ncbi:GNAT family N-acetyltransferase [Halobacillus sp. A1]|uniref:GNAT family N-acetyltransferase n=1 Tax=Halobacillus sp. A1 TaxID=2880262 RepID=UPI0020A66396|nr:GNAT family N-acetyltransferase [Halobacillus sp. A1]MCP3030980.1 GNAT family N-acetyltransferase [Halobacillus sp. A1]